MNESPNAPADHHELRPVPSARGGWLRSRTGIALLGFLVIAGFFLVTEHTAHVFGAVPYLLLLTCPLLHLFGHGGHGGSSGGSDGSRG